MRTRVNFLSIGTVAATILLAASALAGLTSAEQKCLDGYNNTLRLVGQQAGKDYRKCTKDAGKGKNGDPDVCVLADVPGKIAGKEAKVNDLYTSGKCTGAEPIQQGAASGNAYMVDSSQDLVHDVFGDPIAGVVNPGTSEARCQDKAYQRAEQLFTEKLKAFRSCKKSNMKIGTVFDSTTLETLCMTPTVPDPKGKVGKKAAKLSADVNAACAGLPLATLFQGACSGSATTADLGACLERQTECRVCEALNGADGMSRSCDLFDDGVANGSCGIALHTCVLGPASGLQLYIQALPVPLGFGLSGSLDIGANGNISTCQIQSLSPVTIPAIGVFCLSGVAGCHQGARYCGPGAPGSGPPLGIDVQSDANIGACISQADCQAAANSFCGGAANVLTAQCTGYCSGTTPQACTSDAQCLPANGACNGPEPVVPANAGICQVSCVNMAAHGGSDPGDAQCNLGMNLTVEVSAPCDGTDIKIAAVPTCIPLTTQRATALIIDANFIPGQLVPVPPNVNDETGSPLACTTVDTSITTGMVWRGTVNLFGSDLGDASVGLTASCF